MSLKDEAEKLIQVEREKLKARDQKLQRWHERQRKRFTKMRAVLSEIVESTDPQYIKAQFADSSAIITVGWNNERYSLGSIKWRIAPDQDFKNF